MLRFHVKNAKMNSFLTHAEGPFEFGRGPRGDVERCIIEDPLVSRNQLRVEEISGRRVRIDNVSGTNPVLLGDGNRIEIGTSRQLSPPLSLFVGSTTILIDFERETPACEKTEFLDIIGFKKTLAQLGEVPSAQTLMQWLETALELQQEAEDLPDLFDRTARALVEMIGLDMGAVLMLDGQEWKSVAKRARGGMGSFEYSSTMLRRLVEQRRTCFCNDEDVPITVSLRETFAVVVSPIFNVQRDLIGALYGRKASSIGRSQKKITPLEAQVVQLFASAASTRLAKTEATRIRTQFEQFFSPELVRELQNNPKLLEGQEKEITILMCDLRGFSRLSEDLGPQKTCELMRDVMERFTARIAEQGGVIVDYAGDGIFAMWNAPVSQDDHAARACRAALAIADELPKLNERWQSVAGGQLQAGIGINTGLALVGNTGSNRRLKYGPHGNSVNLASRIQDVTKKLGLPLLITGSTQARLPPEFATRRLCTARVRGIVGTVVLFELHGRDASPVWLRRRDEYEAALAEYESGDWCKACQHLVGLIELDRSEQGNDLATVKLVRKAWECLESREDIDPVIDLV